MKKTTTLLTIFLSYFILGCNKNKTDLQQGFNRKWQVYSIATVRLDDSFNQGACSYQTQVSDLYGQPTTTYCQSDDVYDFSHPNTLSIYSGSKKCEATQPGVVTKSYERRGDSLFIDGSAFKIINLSADTLILDYCTDLNLYAPGNIVYKAKVGMKFIAAE